MKDFIISPSTAPRPELQELLNKLKNNIESVMKIENIEDISKDSYPFKIPAKRISLKFETQPIYEDSQSALRESRITE